MKSIFLTLIVSFLLISCASSREHADKYLKNNSTYLAEKCAINFPPITTYIPGVTITDTIIKTVPGAEIPCPEYIDQKGEKQKPTAKCPDQKVIELIRYRTDTIREVDSKKLFIIQNEKADIAAENKKLTDKVKEQKNEIIAQYIIIGLLALVLYLKIKR
ncbi:hypothetical protein [Myroides odoratimimus]|uniref:hypothetical protein n=1 Tax=Myroides odoratimimus TaxID=76832 RepID=UPI002578566C|nr:hypothetical protein [Myroides odoratimimus]MDM1529032.1 hypothetical protein [Myroides odoratimimus]